MTKYYSIEKVKAHNSKKKLFVLDATSKTNFEKLQNTLGCSSVVMQFDMHDRCMQSLPSACCLVGLIVTALSLLGSQATTVAHLLLVTEAKSEAGAALSLSPSRLVASCPSISCTSTTRFGNFGMEQWSLRDTQRKEGQGGDMLRI